MVATMAMTKAHYELVAGVILGRIENAKQGHLFGYSEASIAESVDTLVDLAYFMADAFALHDDKFNKVKFLKGCGL